VFAFFCDHKAAILNSVGLFLTIVGVLLLFRFGVAFQIRTGGHPVLTIEWNQELAEQERRYMWLGALGLAFIVVGTVCQIIANWV
jgi:hypothetical protein